MSDTSRRKLLKSIAAGSGAIVAGKSLPDSWSRPVVDSVILPAHAQTSAEPPVTCSTYAVILEVLSTDGVADGRSDPWPDELDWDGSAGSYTRHLCQSGCVFFELFITSGTTATYQFTTIADQFTVVVTGLESNRYILINMDTGEYALDFAGSAGTCEWPLELELGLGSGVSFLNP